MISIFVTFLFVVDFVDFEVVIYFLQCAALAGSIALTLRHEFDFYSALTSMGSISLTLRHEIVFCSGSLYDIQTPGFLEIVVADSTLTCFCVCFRFSSFPLKWFPASKRSL